MHKNSDALLLPHPGGAVWQDVSPAWTERRSYTKTVSCSNLNSPATLMNLSFSQGGFASAAANGASGEETRRRNDDAQETGSGMINNKGKKKKKEKKLQWNGNLPSTSHFCFRHLGFHYFLPPDLCYSAANKAVQQVCQLRFSASCPTQAAGKSARILISISLAALEGQRRVPHFHSRHFLNE